MDNNHKYLSIWVLHHSFRCEVAACTLNAALQSANKTIEEEAACYLHPVTSQHAASRKTTNREELKTTLN